MASRATALPVHRLEFPGLTILSGCRDRPIHRRPEARVGVGHIVADRVARGAVHQQDRIAGEVLEQVSRPVRVVTYALSRRHPATPFAGSASNTALR